MGFGQWVIAFPRRIRYFLQHDPRRFRAVLRLCMRSIEAHIRARCPAAPRDARVGAVLFAHQFGSSLNAHPHGHLLVTNAVFSLDDEGVLSIHHATELDAQAIAALTETLRKRVLAHLVRHDCLDADDAHDMLGWDHHGGFSLDASVQIADHDRQGLQRLARYCARHPFAKGRLLRAGEQTVIYQLPKPDIHGNTEIKLDPLELLDRLAALILPPRRHRHSYWGALAPHPLKRLPFAGRPPQPAINSSESSAPGAAEERRLEDVSSMIQPLLSGRRVAASWIPLSRQDRSWRALTRIEQPAIGLGRKERKQRPPGPRTLPDAVRSFRAAHARVSSSE